MLETAIPDRVKALEVWCEEREIDPVWNLIGVYGKFRERYVINLKDKSALWADTRIPTDNEITTMTFAQARSAIAALAELPSYLSSAVLDTIALKTAKLEDRIADIAREEVRRHAEAWFASTVKTVGPTDYLTRDACERLLSTLRSPPPALTESEGEAVEAVRRQVEARIDEIDLSDIISRVERLSPAKQKEIIRWLQGTNVMLDA